LEETQQTHFAAQATTRVAGLRQTESKWGVLPSRLTSRRASDGREEGFEVEVIRMVDSGRKPFLSLD
jgi:hypothetical protein